MTDHDYAHPIFRPLLEGIFPSQPFTPVRSPAPSYESEPVLGSATTTVTPSSGGSGVSSAPTLSGADAPDLLSNIDYSRVYRANVGRLSEAHPELVVFFEAPSPFAATRRVSEMVALITRRTVDDVLNAVYNLTTAQELLCRGRSARKELRLFEVEGSFSRYLVAPLFLVANPYPLIKAWLDAQAIDSHACENSLLVRALASQDEENY